MLTSINSYSQSHDIPFRPAEPVLQPPVVSEPVFFQHREVYTDYIKQYSHLPQPQGIITIDIFDMADSYNTSVIPELESASAIRVDEGGFIEWKVNVAEEGLYNINVEYFPIESRGVDIEFCVYINGVMPFAGADAIMLTRVWTDRGVVRTDNRGNEIRPMQMEVPRWETAYLKDAMGYITEPFSFYFHKGENTIRFEPINEPLVLCQATLLSKPPAPTYSQMMDSLDKSVWKKAPEGFLSVIEGETAPFRSSPTLYATYDRSSPGTIPYSVDRTLLNIMGGIQWRIPGQWIEWEVEVPEDGLYNITFKCRQNYNRDNVSVRRLTINGAIPFAEVDELSFAFTRDWKMMTLADDNGTPYL